MQYKYKSSQRQGKHFGILEVILARGRKSLRYRKTVAGQRLDHIEGSDVVCGDDCRIFMRLLRSLSVIYRPLSDE